MPAKNANLEHFTKDSTSRFFRDITNTSTSSSKDMSKSVKQIKMGQKAKNSYKSAISQTSKVSNPPQLNIHVNPTSQYPNFIHVALSNEKKNLLDTLRVDMNMESRKHLRPDSQYMNNQTEIRPHMRQILVDWLMQVCDVHKMTDPTLFLAIDIIDRYLSKEIIFKKNFQLVGIVALMISCKYCEISHPTVDFMTDLTMNTYKHREFKKLEGLILNSLDWSITKATSNDFVHKYVQFLELPCEIANYAVVSVLINLTNNFFKVLDRSDTTLL
jgi:hypothetical protein